MTSTSAFLHPLNGRNEAARVAAMKRFRNPERPLTP